MRQILKIVAAALLTLLVIAAVFGQNAASPAEPDAKALAGLADQLQHYQPGRTRASDDPQMQSGVQLRAALQNVSDSLLEKLLDTLPSRGREGGGYELCLTEIMRRGGAHWEQVLKERFASLSAKNKGQGAFDQDSHSLLLLTALRRVQKKEDPLPILIEGKSQIEAKLSYLPELTAVLANLDAERAQVAIDVGGDYRGASRHNKWHIAVTDANGRRLPEREETDMGGFGHPEVLEYQESVPMNLNLGSYVSIDKPGTYTMVVMFHPNISIGLIQDTTGLICCQSRQLTLVVEPITVETNPVEQARAAALVGQLPATGAVHILAGRYNESVGEFMPKDSPAAQLHEMDWNAVPALIKAVNSGQLNATQRAWALGLLFGITDQRNPMEAPGVIGAYEYRHSGWVTFGGGPGSGASQSRSAVTVLVGAVDEEAQKQFARGWQAWLDNGVLQIKMVEEKPKP